MAGKALDKRAEKDKSAKGGKGRRDSEPQSPPAAPAAPAAPSSTAVKDIPASAVPAVPSASPGGAVAILRAVGGFVVEALSSIVLGLVLLGVILVWVALGTFDQVLQAFDFAMLDWYVWWPFQAVLYLMCINLAVVTVRKIPFDLPRLGVWVIHGSVLMIAAGSTWFGLGWTDAVTRIDRGHVQTHAYDQVHSALHVWRPQPGGELFAHPENGSGYGPGDLSRQFPIHSSLTEFQPRGQVRLTDAALGSLAAGGVPESVVARLRQLRPREFASMDEYRSRVAGIMLPQEWERHGPAVLKAAEPDEYRVGPFAVDDGLTLTITASLPTVRLNLTQTPRTENPSGGATITTQWALPGDTGVRRTFWDNDPPDRRIDVLDEEEPLARLGELMRRAYDADAAAKASGAVGAAGQGEARAALAEEADRRRMEAEAHLRKMSEEPPQARTLLRDPRVAPMTAERFEGVAAFYSAFRADARDPVGERSMPFPPPAPVERVIITDPAMDRPAAVYLEEWETAKDRTIRLDRAGAPGVRLVLLEVNRGGPTGTRRGGPPMVLYRVEVDGKPAEQRLCVGVNVIDPSRMPKHNPADGDADAVMEAIRRAAVPVTARGVARIVQYRTAAVQAVAVLDRTPGAAGDAVVFRPLLWAADPSRPTAVVPPVSLDEDDPRFSFARQFTYHNLPWGSRTRQAALLVSKTADAEPGFKIDLVRPDSPDAKNARRIIRVLAEYRPPATATASAAGPAAGPSPAAGPAPEGGVWRKEFLLQKVNFPDLFRRIAPGEAVTRLEIRGYGPLEVAWGGVRVPLGVGGKVAARLEHFRLDLLPGVDQRSEMGHKEYSSFVTFTDGNTGDAQTVKICMNEPKKADGYWFSQNSYDPENLAWTVLSVAHKPAWSDPPIVPYAMVTMVLGVMWAFLVRPLLRKKGGGS